MPQRRGGFGGRTLSDLPDHAVLHRLVNHPVPAMGSQIRNRGMQTVYQPQLPYAEWLEILDKRHALDPGPIADPSTARPEELEGFLDGHSKLLFRAVRTRRNPIND